MIENQNRLTVKMKSETMCSYIATFLFKIQCHSITSHHNVTRSLRQVYTNTYK